MRPPRFLLGSVLLLAVFGSAAAEDSSARVAVYAEHQGGNVIYHYEVRNTGSAEVRRFFVGCDCRWPLDAIGELQTLPVGAVPARTDDLGTWYDLPVDTPHPSGWRVRLLRPAGTNGHWMEWYMPAARAKAGIGPGASLGGFTVVVPGADDAYLAGNFTVLAEGRTGASAPLALLDTVPPALSLETRAMPADTGTAAVRVVATAKDDRDPEPRVVVEAMSRADTSDQPGYVVVYSATDASGNRTTASARVPLPAAAGTQLPDVPAVPAPPRPSVPVNWPRLAFSP